MIKLVINEIAEKINYGIDQGVTIEIRDCLKCEENVSSFNLEVVESRIYLVTIKLKTFNLQEVKKVFSSLLHFIEYSSGTFYTRDKKEDSIEYTVLSSMEDMSGFYCKLIFS